MRALYTLGILLYTLGIRVVAMFGHHKARLMVQGWRQWRDKAASLDQERPVAWFHASSMGEFEQARPVIERFRAENSQYQVVLTFFSPSGYEACKNYRHAEVVCYLPPDLPWHVGRFIGTCRPCAAYFVKYDHWFNYLHAMRKRQEAPVYIFSAIFRPGQYFFRPWGRWFLRQLRTGYRHIFVQNEQSLQLLRVHGFTEVSLAGDTRYDRVNQIAREAAADEVTERWLEAGPAEAPVVVAGSTWPPDERLLAEVMQSEEALPVRWVVAPHVVSRAHVESLRSLPGSTVLYSELKSGNGDPSARVLIVDNIGLLSRLYRYARVAYIGGGFGVGIHNTLEAIAFGKPVIFGPNYSKFQEAHDILALGGGWTVEDADQMKQALLPLLDSGAPYDAATEACRTLMRRNLGSTDIILPLAKP